MKLTRSIGMLLLGIFLIIHGLIGVFGISLGQLSVLVPLLALIAGILILLGR